MEETFTRANELELLDKIFFPLRSFSSRQGVWRFEFDEGTSQ